MKKKAVLYQPQRAGRPRPDEIHLQGDRVVSVYRLVQKPWWRRWLKR